MGKKERGAETLGFAAPRWDIKLNVIFAILLGAPYLLTQFHIVDNVILQWIVNFSWLGFGLKNLAVTYLFGKHVIRKYALKRNMRT